MDAPTDVGCLMEARIIGIIVAVQTQGGKPEADDRLLGVAVHSYDHERIKTINDVSKTLLDQNRETSANPQVKPWRKLCNTTASIAATGIDNA